MIIYRCNINNTDLGTMVTWHSSYAAARRHQLDHADEGSAWNDLAPGVPASISITAKGYDWSADLRLEKYEMEPTKERFLRWLNAYFDTDNG